MTPPRLEVADVIRRHGDAFLDRYGDALRPEQRRALSDIAACRTAALGGHVEDCDRCGHRQVAYNSCRNRHCPKCQATAAADWTEAREAELLPVAYFHVVFTLPAALDPIALQNPRVVYGLLFQAAAATLRQVAADPKHLGAEIGFLAVLHTWGQNLQHHPHVHCVVPGGGLAPDASRWVACRPRFFLPVRVLSRVFRGKFLSMLRAAFDRGRLAFHGKLRPLTDPGEFRRRLADSARTEWVVYAKPPFGGPRQVLKYLARYTHRVAISNRRLTALEGDQVTFGWKDYAARREAEDDDPERDGVPPPFPLARPADGVRADQALRLPRQPGVSVEAGTVPEAVVRRHAARRGRGGPRAASRRRRTARGPRLPRLR